MHILIIAATPQEVAPFVQLHPHTEIHITGVSVPATLFSLQQKLLNKQYDFIIQAGVCGAFTDDFDLGQVTLVSTDRFADTGAMETDGFNDVFDMKLADGNAFPYRDGWLDNNTPLLHTLDLPKVKAITINTIHADKAYNDVLYKKYNVDIESMEGAAFHFCCLQQKISFLQLRAISNYVGERKKENWKLKESIAHLNRELEKLVTILLK